MALPGFSSAAIENPEAGGVSQTPIAITFLAIDTHNAPGGLVGRGHELATVFHGLSGPHAPGSLGYLGWKPRPAPANHWGGAIGGWNGRCLIQGFSIYREIGGPVGIG